MQRSAEAGVLLAVLRRCNAAWKNSSQAGPGLWAAAAKLWEGSGSLPSMCLPFPLESHLRLPLAFQPRLGRLPSAGSLFSQEQASRLGRACLSRGLPGLSQIPCWSSAASERDSGQSSPSPRSGLSVWKGESFLHCSLPQALTSAGCWREDSPHKRPAHSFRAHLGRLLTRKGRLSKAGWLAGAQDGAALGYP